MDWPQLAREHLWYPYTQMLTAPAPLCISHADGIYLHTTDGRRIIDGISSWWVNIHGHNHPRLNRAISEQAAKMAQVIFAGLTHEPAARLAAALVQKNRQHPAAGILVGQRFDCGGGGVENGPPVLAQSRRTAAYPVRRPDACLSRRYVWHQATVLASGNRTARLDSSHGDATTEGARDTQRLPRWHRRGHRAPPHQ